MKIEVDEVMHPLRSNGKTPHLVQVSSVQVISAANGIVIYTTCPPLLWQQTLILVGNTSHARGKYQMLPRKTVVENPS